jgi:hypothetical protein
MKVNENYKIHGPHKGDQVSSVHYVVQEWDKVAETFCIL